MTPWARDRRRIRALQGQVQPFAMISLRERQCFHLPLQGALTWVVRVPRVPFTSPPARFILPWARFLLPLRGAHRQSCSHANENKRQPRQQGQHFRGVHVPRRSPPIAFKCRKHPYKKGRDANGSRLYREAGRMSITSCTLEGAPF